jgi:ABC-type transport system involved in cytochrome c biogenesis permease subunit
MRGLLLVALFFYTWGLVQSVLTLLQKKHLPFMVTILTVIAGFLLHTWAMILRGLEVQRCPIALQPELFCYLGWVLISYYLIANLNNRNRMFLNYLFPLAYGCILLSSLLPLPAIDVVDPRGLHSPVSNVLFPVHVSLVIFAYAAFFVTFLTGIMYIWQERKLKLKQFKGLIKLPALDICDAISYKSTNLGFILLTLGMVTGIVWSGRRDGIYWHANPTEMLTLITWMIYMFMIHYRLTAGWRGRRAAIVGIIGFLFVVVSLVSLRYLGHILAVS